jgi:hypothetical protein
MSTKCLENVMHPEGHVVKRQVAPLEHVVHSKGHVAQEKWKEASGTLGARGAS